MTAAPLTGRITATIPAQTAAAVADQSIGRAPYAGTVARVSLTPEADITGATATARTFTCINKGADGNGTTVVATLATTTGVNLTDFNEQDFTLSAVAGATTVAEGDILAVAETVASTGTAHSGGLITIEIART